MANSKAEAANAHALDAIGSRLAKDIVDCDPGIMSLIVMRKGGVVIAVRRSSRLQELEYIDEETVKLFGVRASVVLGAADTAGDLFGSSEAVIGTYKKGKVLLIRLKEYNLDLGLRLSRSASGEYIYSKIQGLLGIS